MSVCERVPDDSIRVEDGTVETRPDELECASRVPGEHDAAVAPPETTAHDLFE
jgi:hypothetical protein